MARRGRDEPVDYTLDQMFEKFAKFGDTKSDGKKMCLSASDTWMKQSGLIPDKFTLTETGMGFYKYKKRSISFQDYEKFLQELAKLKNVDYNDMVAKMTTCGLPGSNPDDMPAKRKR